nr:class II aldolase/adducin family protein [Clostridia bacterium]
MEEKLLRMQIVETGLQLLEHGLVARTWGNVSALLDDSHMLISPSGRDYKATKPEDIALYDIAKDSWTGKYKPSSEKGVHIAAYRILEDARFVIHTHQTFATAFGLWGADTLEMSGQERKKLCGLAVAEYALPGTGELVESVSTAFRAGAHSVLMQHHGVVIAGTSKEDAMEKALLLEEICRRNYKGHDLSENAALVYSRLQMPLMAQLDDMAQMIGPSIPLIVGNVDLALQNFNAVIVPEKGISVRGENDDDTEALEILAEKAAITALHLIKNNVTKELSPEDIKLMHENYVNSYSKQKNAD